MLEDDLWATSQKIMVANRPASTEQPKPRRAPPENPRPANARQTNQPPPPSLPPLSVTFEQLLPIVRELPDFKWPEPIRFDPDQRDRKKKCSYHKDHGHTIERCRHFQWMIEKLWRVGYLDQYVRAADPPTVPRVPPEGPARGIIRVIHGSCSNAQTNSRRKRRKLAHTAAVSEGGVPQAPVVGNNDLPIDAPISFPPLDGHRVVAPHDDALVLTLNIG